jgi:hypothetical protein
MASAAIAFSGENFPALSENASTTGEEKWKAQYRAVRGG